VNPSWSLKVSNLLFTEDELRFMFLNDFINDFRCFINAKQVEKEYNFNAFKECLKL
jgi:hypothetical protein